MKKKMVKIKDLLLRLFIPSECEACKWKKQCNINRNEEEYTKIRKRAAIFNPMPKPSAILLRRPLCSLEKTLAVFQTCNS